jgi:hypothetical protein
MNRFFIILTIFFSSAALLFAGDVTKNFNNKDFNQVSICCGMKLRVNQADNFSIKITADQKDFEFLTVEQKDNSLNIYINKNNYRIRSDIRIEITMPDLTGMNLSGGAMGNINMKTTSDFNADLSGGAFLKGNLECRNVELGLSGGSKVEMQGAGENIDLSGSGGSIFNLSDFAVKDVESKLSGGSNVKVKMDGTLNTSQSGGSQFIFYGTAKIGRTSFSGGSGVSKADD